ncbi:MAG TPA: hypothetical protein DIT15_02890 [Arthrobacter bacterium]|nr:hypothetical protein [Arthrobacter sp.]
MGPSPGLGCVHRCSRLCSDSQRTSPRPRIGGHAGDGPVDGRARHCPRCADAGLHALATVATALILARGEAAVWALAAWLRPLTTLLSVPVIHTLPAVPARPVVFVPSRWRSLRLPARRGPASSFPAY